MLSVLLRMLKIVVFHCPITSIMYMYTVYHPISITVISGRLPARPITHTGRLLHTAKKKVNRLPALVDNPHVVIQLFGGENVTLR